MTTPDIRVLVDLEHDINPASGVFPQPTWTDLTSYLRAPANGAGFSIVRGRFRDTDRVEAGRWWVDFGNEGAEFLPFNVDSPFHPFILPDRRLRIEALDETGLSPFRMRSSRNRGGDVQRGATSAEIVLADGLIDRWVFTFPGRGADAVARAECVDFLATMAEDEVTASPVNSFSGERIEALLDEATYAADRNIDAGIIQVQGKTYTDANLLEALREIERTEGGVLYVARDGAIRFRAASARTEPARPESRFSVAAIDHPFVDIELEYDRTLIRNIVRVSAPSLTDVEVTDADSIARHGDRPFEVETLAQNQSDLSVIADDYLNRYGRPVPAVRELDLSDITDDWVYVLSRDIWDAVILEIEFPGGVVLEQHSLIEQIRIAAPRKTRWSVVWRLSAQEFPNLLSDNQESLETDATGWVAETNCTVQQATHGTFYGFGFAKALVGAKSLELRPLAEGDLSAITDPTGAIAVDHGVVYRATANFARTRPLFAGVDPNVRVEVDWLDAGDTLISTSVGEERPFSFGTLWLAASVTAQAPAGAVSADMRAVVVGYEEDFYVGVGFPIYFYIDLNTFRRLG